MVVLGERAIETVLQDAMTTFLANLTYFIPEIYQQETSEHQQELQTWFANSKNTIAIQLGYNLQKQKEPQIAVTTELASEVGNRRPIGHVGNQYSTQRQYQTDMGGTFNVHCVGPNQNFLLWLQAWVRWALLYQRKNLEDNFGLMNQRIQLQALRPVPDSLSDVIFPFMRVVTLNCEWMDSWTDLPGTAVAATSITLSN